MIVHIFSALLFLCGSFWNTQYVKYFDWEDPEFEISATIEGLPAATVIYLVRNKDEGGADTVTQTLSEYGGRFTFKGQLSLEGEPYFIKIKGLANLQSAPLTSSTYMLLILENRPITITGNINDLSDSGITIKGSMSHEEYLDFMIKDRSNYDMINARIAPLMKRFENKEINSKDYNRVRDSLIKPLWDKKAEQVAQWIFEHPKSYIAPWVIMTNGGSDIEWMEKYWIKLSAEAKQGYSGVKLRNTISLLKKISTGAIAADFKVPTGTQVSSLKEIASSSRYTVLIFWASWCGPCKASIPSLKEIYSKYKNKGLHMVGYSIDKDKQKWGDAVKKEELPWYNVLETDLFAQKEYGVNEVPHYYILDKERKVVAHYQNTISLSEKLIALLGE